MELLPPPPQEERPPANRPLKKTQNAPVKKRLKRQFECDMEGPRGTRLSAGQSLRGVNDFCRKIPRRGVSYGKPNQGPVFAKMD